MPQTGNQNFGEVARVAFDIWRALEGGTMANANINPEAAQKALRRYYECLKAVSGDDFDLSKIT